MKNLIVAVVAAGALAACASDPPAKPALAASASSLEAARAAGATEFAPVQLGSARTKLDRARALAEAGHQREAVRMAEEADADAQLASAMAGSERSRRAVAEVEASLRTLREELNRATTLPAQPGMAPSGPLAQPRPQ